LLVALLAGASAAVMRAPSVQAQAAHAPDAGTPAPSPSSPLPDVYGAPMAPTISEGTGSPPATPPTAATPRESSSWNALPILSYSRETELAFGAFGVVYFRLGDAPPESRPSFFGGTATFTTRAQIFVDTYPELWWDHERWMLSGQVAYRRSPEYFFGIGNDTHADAREPYTLHTFWSRFDLRYRAWKALFVGARHEFQWHELRNLDHAPLLAAGTIRGAEGGWRHGIGPTLVWDSRDNTLAARSGVYYQVSFLAYGGFLGSDYDYARLTLDARHYISLAPEHTLAFELFLDALAGDVPFNQLAQLGGSARMRGYYEGQFRDKTYAMAQVEYRLMPLFWRIGVVVFAGVGEVAERWRDFSFEGLKWAVGVGLRYALNVEERIHVRLDVGVGPSTWGLNVTILEAF
jgi:hypothetical protein